MKNRWKLIKKNIVFKNAFLTLRDDEVKDPNGNLTKRNLLEAGLGSVIIIPISSDNNTYLVGQSRYAVNEYSWEFPNGGIKQNETPLAAARRELAEELNLEAGKWRELMIFHPNNSLMNRKTFVFLAENLKSADNKLSKDSYELIDVRKISLKNLEREIKDNKILDAYTLCAFLSLMLEKPKLFK